MSDHNSSPRAFGSGELKKGLSENKGRFVVCLTMCHFVLVFFSPFSMAITSLGEERANLSAFSTFVRFVLV